MAEFCDRRLECDGNFRHRFVERAQTHAGGSFRLCQGAGRNLGISRAAFVGARLFLLERRRRAPRRRHLEKHLPADAGQARGGARGRRHRPDHDIRQQVVVSDRRRIDRAGGRRCADGAARDASPQAGGGGPVRSRAQAIASLYAARHRRGDLARRGRDSRHPASTGGSVSRPCPGLAGARPGRNFGRGSGVRDPRIQCARTPGKNPSAGFC